MTFPVKRVVAFLPESVPSEARPQADPKGLSSTPLDCPDPASSEPVLRNP